MTRLYSCGFLGVNAVASRKMGHAELLVVVTSSYLLSLWGLERWRRFGKRVSSHSRRELSQPHLRRALGPLWSIAANGDALLTALERRDPQARALAAAAASGLAPPQRALLAAAVGLWEAEQQTSVFQRYRLARRALRQARAARALGVPAAYLECLLLLGILSDGLIEDLRLWQTGRLLRHWLRRQPGDPLLQLALALRCAVGGAPTEAVAALARALYHARGDPFVASCILAFPLVEELAPGLAAEARRASSSVT